MTQNLKKIDPKPFFVRRTANWASKARSATLFQRMPFREMKETVDQIDPIVIQRPHSELSVLIIIISKAEHQSNAHLDLRFLLQKATTACLGQLNKTMGKTQLRTQSTRFLQAQKKSSNYQLNNNNNNKSEIINLGYFN